MKETKESWKSPCGFLKLQGVGKAVGMEGTTQVMYIMNLISANQGQPSYRKAVISDSLIPQTKSINRSFQY